IIAVADLDLDRARSLAGMHGSDATPEWLEVVGRTDVDAVVVATFNSAMLPIVTAAVQAGKDVLCEKPLGRDATEAGEMVGAAASCGRVLKVGFNHRHHPALVLAHRLVGENAVGAVFAIRAAYGHGGRAGYDRE